MILLTVIFIVFGYLNNTKHEDSIKKNKCYTFGRVTKYEYNYKSTKGYVYEFYINGKTNTDIYLFGSNGLPIINKIFPVVYDCNDPDNNALLVLPKNFADNDENFPDSLTWLKQYDN